MKQILIHYSEKGNQMAVKFENENKSTSFILRDEKAAEAAKEIEKILKQKKDGEI